MATKKPAKTTTEIKSPNATATFEELPSTPVGGIVAEDIEVLEGDIDSRMKALLKDHQKMGARPK